MKSRFLSLLFVALNLAACGGGGSGGGTPPPAPPTPVVAQPTAQDIAEANAAAVTAAVDDSTHKVTLAWSDTVVGANSYSVQQQASGTWTTVGTIAGLHGSRTLLSWVGTAGAAGTTSVFRVQAVFADYTVLLATLGMQNQITVVYPTGAATIAFDQAEPVTGLVTVSISGAGTYASVDYFLDLAALGASSTGPTYPVTVPLGSPGSHLVLARLKTGLDSFLEVRRTVQVAEPGYRVYLASEDQGDTLVVKSYTRGGVGTSTVTAYVDDVSLGTLTSTNYVGTAGPAYRWLPPATDFTSGPHTVKVNATDGSGATATSSLIVTVSNPPKLTLTSPAGNTTVSGTLQLRGTATSDRPGPVNVLAKLGNVTLLNAPGSPFSADYSLAGLPAGPYDFTITATDSGGISAQSSAVVTVTATALPASSTLPAIEFDQVEPVRGLVTASIAGAGSYSAVDWYVDLGFVGSSTSAPTYSLLIPPGGPGSHLVIARLKTGPDSFIELRRTLEAAQPAYQVFLASEDQGDTVVVKAYTIAGVGTSTLTAFIDGVSLGTLTATNYVGTVGPAYIWRVPSTDYASGQHTVRVDAADQNGATSGATVIINVSNPPILTLTSPFDGMIVNGTLQIRGTATSDRPGPVNVVGKLGSLTVLSTTSSPFSVDFSLAGLPPGSYTYSIKATDAGTYTVESTGVVVVTAATAAYVPLRKSIGQFGGSLLAVGEDTRALVELADHSVHMLTASADVVLDTAGVYPADWKLEGGNALAVGPVDGGTSGLFHTLHWSADGARHDLGFVIPSLGSTSHITAAHWPYVLVGDFSGGGSRLNFFNAVTAQSFAPTLISPASFNQGGGDFYLAQDGSPVLYYTQALAGGSIITPIGIARWTQATNQNASVASDVNLLQTNVMTDGTRLAWATQSVTDVGNYPRNLVTLNIATNAQQTLSTIMSKFSLAHGLLAWTEVTGAGPQLMQVIKVSNGTTVTTLSTVPYANLYGVGDGYVLIDDDGPLVAANAQGVRRVVLETMPSNPQIAGKSVYFTLGAEKAVYCVTLP